MINRIPLSELQLIQTLYKANFTQKEIKLKVDSVRHEEGRFTGKGVSTNTISELSPGSKHRERRTTAIHDYHSRYSVIYNIMHCLGCDKKEAERIYKSNVLPLCIGRFHQESMYGLVSIRYHAPGCNQELYFIFTTEDYAESMGLDESHHITDVWTVKTDREYKEILTGELSRSDIQDILAEYADGEYIPELLNVTVRKY